MKPLSVSVEVMRNDWTTYGRPGSGLERGSGYCLDQGTTQTLVKRWRLWGRVIWTKVLGTENVPSFVPIEVGTLGSANWRSKFAEYIK